MSETGNAAAAIKEHHRALVDGLQARNDQVLNAVRSAGDARAAAAAEIEFLDAEILPHAVAEEATLYGAAAHGASALLVEAMVAEHRNLRRRIDALRTADDGPGVLAASSAVLALFEAHVAKENEQLLPALERDPTVSLDELLAGMHELVG